MAISVSLWEAASPEEWFPTILQWTQTYNKEGWHNVYVLMKWYLSMQHNEWNIPVFDIFRKRTQQFVYAAKRANEEWIDWTRVFINKTNPAHAEQTHLLWTGQTPKSLIFRWVTGILTCPLQYSFEWLSWSAITHERRSKCTTAIYMTILFAEWMVWSHSSD